MNQVIRGKILDIGTELKSEFVERNEVVDGSLAAILAEQHVVLLGPPGIAKSALINELCLRIEGANWFQWLLTKFSTPEEIFGPISLKGLEQDEFRRIVEHKLPTAHIAFLDEIFKANSAILNTLLTVINERKFHNNGSPVNIPLCSMFGASNELPENSNELGALYDRFLIRFHLQPIQEDGDFLQMLEGVGAQTQKSTTLSLTELAQAQAEVRAVQVPKSVLETLVKIRKDLQAKGLYNSDRRYKQLLSILQANAWLDGRQAVNDEDLEVLEHCLWTEPKDRSVVSEVVLTLASPFKAQLREINQLAQEAYDMYEKARSEFGEDSDKAQTAGTEGSIRLKKLINQVKALEIQAKDEGRDLHPVKEMLDKVQGLQKKILADIAGL
jgi:MoxR-like ATPase